jgi:hypothetical protein
MNINIKIFFVIVGLVLGSALYAVTGDELLAKQNEISSLLQEYWMDKDGNVRIGDKDTTSLRFSFSKNLIDKMTDLQLRSSMDTALARFPKEQQEAFKSVVVPLLDDLKKNREAIVAEGSKLKDAAETLAKALNKTPQDIMRLPDENLKSLIIDRITDRAARIAAIDQLTNFSKLRKEDVTKNKTTVAEDRRRATEGSSDDDDEPKKIGTKTKIAQGIADTNFKISSMTGFVGTALGYGLCRSRHWDIVQDSKGYHFLSEAKP